MKPLNHPLAIRGLGCVGGFGSGLESFHQALTNGGCAPRVIEQQHGDGLSYAPAYLAQTDALSDYVAKRSLRRLDHYARLALLGGCLALEDAGIEAEARQRVGVIIASGYGASSTTFSFLDSVLEDGDHCASPTNFSNSVHNVAAAYLSMQLGLLGPNLTLSQFEMSVTSALYNAACWLEQGRVDTVLVGGVDEHCPVLNYCYRRYFDAMAEKMEPLDFERQSAIPGEGAAFVVLSRDPAQARYGLIDAVASGRCDQEGALPDGPLLLGADGQQNTGNRYRQLDPQQVVGCCSPCYGSLPTGQAFDLVAAGLMMRDQRCYVGDGSQAAAGPLDRLTSLKLTADGQYGAIRIVAR